MPENIKIATNIRNIRCRVKNSNGVYEAIHPETNSNQVIMNNGISLQNDIDNLKNTIKNVDASTIKCSNGESLETVLNRILKKLDNTLILRE